MINRENILLKIILKTQSKTCHRETNPNKLAANEVFTDNKEFLSGATGAKRIYKNSLEKN